VGWTKCIVKMTSNGKLWTTKLEIS
jgi:hypothetical protein